MTPASWNYTVYTLISFVACVSPIKGERREGDGIAELISPTGEAIFYHFLSTGPRVQVCPKVDRLCVVPAPTTL